jgi:hypothetical protein
MFSQDVRRDAFVGGCNRETLPGLIDFAIQRSKREVLARLALR